MALRRRRSSPRPGFTLVEVMISTVIYSMFMVVVMNAMSLTRKLGRYQEDTGKVFLEAYTARVWAEEDMRNFVPPPRSQAEQTPLQVDRTGDDAAPQEKITFWSAVQRPFERQGVYQVSWESDGGQLVRKVRWGSDAGGGSQVSEQRFLSNVKGLAVRFKTLPEDEPMREWPFKYLPRYIYLRVVFAGSGPECEWTLSLGQVS